MSDDEQDTEGGDFTSPEDLRQIASSPPGSPEGRKSKKSSSKKKSKKSKSSSSSSKNGNAWLSANGDGEEPPPPPPDWGDSSPSGKSKKKKEKKKEKSSSSSKSKRRGSAKSVKSTGDENDNHNGENLEETENGKQASSKKRSSSHRSSSKKSSATAATTTTATPKESSSSSSTLDPKFKPIKRPPQMQQLDGSPYKNPFRAWMHAPKKFKEEGSQVTFKVPKKTDFWRKSQHHDDFIMDNAPFYWHKVVGDFEVLVHISGEFSQAGQKAGLMIRMDPENWMTTALEFHDNVLNHSTCITRDSSDCSFVVCPAKAAVAQNGIWLCAKKLGNTYESYFSTNGQTWTLTRQGLLHVDAESVRLGIFAAAPFTAPTYHVTFDMYQCHIHR